MKKHMYLKKAALTTLSAGLLLFPLAACGQTQTASVPAPETEPALSAPVEEQAGSPSEFSDAPADSAAESSKKKRPQKSGSGQISDQTENSTNASSSGKKSRPSKGGSSGSTESSDSSSKSRPSKDSSSGSAENSDSSSKSRPSQKKSSSGNFSKSSSGSSSRKSSSGKSAKKSSSQAAGTAVKSLADGETLTGGTFTAEKADESAIDASGSVTASVTGASIIKKAGDASSASASSFQGVNAGVRVYGNATVTLSDCTIESSASNATGVFAYDKGTVYLKDSTVTVTGGGAGGVQVAGGGTLYGSNLTVKSASKAAIRSDKGGGTMVLDGGTYTSTGSNGCPAIYSTADITVSNATCVSEKSRAVIIEGKNTVTLENCVVSGNDQSTKEGSVKANVLLYQSASGDAAEGTSVFTMRGGSMTSLSGAMFYCTNTASVINLDNADLILSEDGTLLIVSAGRWGKDGKNGGSCVVNAANQSLSGTVTVDAVSSLTLNLTDSVFTGSIQNSGTVDVHMNAGSAWKLTGDSFVSTIDGDLSGLDLNGFTLYVNGIAYQA